MDITQSVDVFISWHRKQYRKTKHIAGAVSKKPVSLITTA